MNAEENPAEELPPIVGAADPLEAPALRDASLLSPRLSQIAQGVVSHQVEVFKENEESNQRVHELLAASPLGRAVVWVQEEVHVHPAEDDPVVEAVL